MEAKNKEEYIEAWKSHIDQLGILSFVHSEELSKEVVDTIKKLKDLVEKVAEDKGLK